MRTSSAVPSEARGHRRSDLPRRDRMGMDIEDGSRLALKLGLEEVLDVAVLSSRRDSGP